MRDFFFAMRPFVSNSSIFDASRSHTGVATPFGDLPVVDLRVDLGVIGPSHSGVDVSGVIGLGGVLAGVGRVDSQSGVDAGDARATGGDATPVSRCARLIQSGVSMGWWCCGVKKH